MMHERQKINVKERRENESNLLFDQQLFIKQRPYHSKQQTKKNEDVEFSILGE